MQIGAINSTNFKGNTINYDFEAVNEDINKARDLQNVLDSFTKKDGNDNEKPRKKNAFEIVASIGATFLVAFLLSKKLYKHAGKFIETVKNSKLKDKIQKTINNSDAIKNITNTAKEKFGSFKLPENLKQNKILTKIKDMTPESLKNGAHRAFEAIKNNPQTSVSAAAALAGTAYVASSDSDSNGTLDIAEKGTNAVKGAVKKISILTEAIEGLT